MPVTRMHSRDLRGELMDDPAIDPDTHRRALRGLERINRFCLSASVLWRTLSRWFADSAEPRRVLDIACGGGDLAVALTRRAQRSGVPLTVDGSDISPFAVRYAAQHAERVGVNSRFFELDALNDPIPDGYDAILCTLFLHHLEDIDALRLLRRMREHAPRVIVDDLVRTRKGFAMAWLGTRMLSRSPVVHTDGPRSVQAALSPVEMLGMAQVAGMRHAQLKRHFPQRMTLVWSEP